MLFESAGAAALHTPLLVWTTPPSAAPFFMSVGAQSTAQPRHVESLTTADIHPGKLTKFAVSVIEAAQAY